MPPDSTTNVGWPMRWMACLQLGRRYRPLSISIKQRLHLLHIGGRRLFFFRHRAGDAIAGHAMLVRPGAKFMVFSTPRRRYFSIQIWRAALFAGVLVSFGKSAQGYEALATNQDHFQVTGR